MKRLRALIVVMSIFVVGYTWFGLSGERRWISAGVAEYSPPAPSRLSVTPRIEEPITSAARIVGRSVPLSVVGRTGSGSGSLGDSAVGATFNSSLDLNGTQAPLPSYCNQGKLKDWRPGKCADDKAWLIPWMAKRPKADWVLVDVGANKGYVISEWLEVLLKDTKFTSMDLGVEIFRNMGSKVKKGFMGLCGGCCECVEAPAKIPDEHRASKVRIWAYEPGVANFKWLHSFFRDHTLVNITNAAVSSADGQAYFPDEEFGKETGKVLSTPAKGYVPVQILTLDSHLSHVPFIHVLSTDAEGFDQEVAKGAESFLAQGRVGVYQFEMYKEMDYKPVFDRLEQWGYICWFATTSRKIRVRNDRDKQRLKKWVFAQIRKFKITKGEALHPLVPRFVRITGCWEQQYNSYHGWVNGLCHNSNITDLNDIFETISKEKWRRAGGNCDSKVTQVTMVDTFIKKHISPLGIQAFAKGAAAAELSQAVQVNSSSTAKGEGDDPL